MSLPTFNTWKEAIQDAAVASLDEQLQGLTDDIQAIADGTFPEETDKIVGDNGISFITQSSNDRTKVVLFHHLQKIVGRRGVSDIHVAIVGLGAIGQPVALNLNDLLDRFEIDAPLWPALRDTTDADFVTNTEPIDPFKQVYETQRLAILPPFITNIIVEHPNETAQQLFHRVVAKTKEFQAAQEALGADKKCNPSEDANVQAIIALLWSIGNGFRTAVAGSGTILVTNDVIPVWGATQHRLYLNPPVGSAPSTPADMTIPLSEFARSVDSQTAELRASRLSREDHKNSFARLSDMNKQLVLNASAVWDVVTGSYVVPTEPVKSAQDFFAIKTSAEATAHLISHMTFVRKQSVVIPGSVGLALSKGFFLWQRDDRPGNFASVSFPPSSGVHDTGQNDLLVFSTKTTEGRGLSNEDIAKLLEEGGVPAQTVDALKKSLRALMDLSKFFFGRRSELTIELEHVLEHYEDHETHYQTCTLGDRDFPAKFQYRIDRGVYLWLRACSLHASRGNVDSSLIDFRRDTSDVVRDVFMQNLPRHYSRAFTNIDDHAKPSPNKKAKGNKRPKDKEIRALSPNTSPHPSLVLKDDDSWSKQFAGKHLEMLPKYKDKTVCHRFHVLGSCFSDCHKAPTHCKEALDSGDNLSKMQAWCQTCRN